MNRLLFISLFFLLIGCSNPTKQSQVSVYEADFKTIFQVAISSLKDRRFVIKNYDWNSGEIDSYLIYGSNSQKKEVVANVSLEQSGTKVKVRITAKKSDTSSPISTSDLRSIEKDLFDSIDEAILKK